ncbi:MAG: putative oxidoreductase [Proteobacteria bacterium]|nr:putative oxidoreductase [Pseudomonadota bacterium]
MKKIATGLIGFGMGGQVFHGPLLAGDGGFALKAVSGSRFAEFAGAYPATAQASCEQIIADSQIELVVITTPNATHGALARSALQAGKHVVVDKPFCLSSREAQDLVNLARERRLMLSVFHNRRRDGDFLTVKQLLRDVTLGTMVSLESNYDRYRVAIRDSWKEDQTTGGGLLWDIGAHLVDQAVELFGVPRSWSGDFRRTRPGAQTPDDFEIRLDYSPALRVTLRAAMVRAWPGPRFVVHGLNGSYVKFGKDPQEKDLQSGKALNATDWGREDPARWGSLLLAQPEGIAERRLPTLAGAYPSFYRGVAKAIRAGTPPPVDPASVIPTIRILEDLAQQADARRD